MDHACAWRKKVKSTVRSPANTQRNVCVYNNTEPSLSDFFMQAYQWLQMEMSCCHLLGIIFTFDYIYVHLLSEKKQAILLNY